MKIRCIRNTGADLQPYEYEQINNNKVFGRFGVSGNTEFEIVLGEEYLVMGIIIFKTYQGYLIDSNGLISVYPCQLFEVIDDKINSSNWHFRLIDKNEEIYPFIQIIFGYPELCFDKMAYENLIVEKEEHAERIYFNRKKELLERDSIYD